MQGTTGVQAQHHAHCGIQINQPWAIDGSACLHDWAGLVIRSVPIGPLCPTAIHRTAAMLHLSSPGSARNCSDLLPSAPNPRAMTRR